MKIKFILPFLFLIYVSQISAQTDESKVYKNYSINQFVEILKPSQAGDFAVGIQGKGKLANVLTNNGELSSFHVYSPALEWPAFGEGQDDQQQYGWGVNLMMANKRIELDTIIFDVIESFKDPASDRKDHEWKPANENLFSGNVTVSETDLIPIMATSDNRKTWPIENGQPFWPGLFRIDTLGNVYSNQFTSERDLYCVYTDDGNDKTYGLRVEQTAYSFGRRYAEDFLVYRFNIKNTSSTNIDSLYPGMMIQFLIDFDNHDLINFIDTNDDGSNDLIYMWDQDKTPFGVWSKVGYVGLLVVKSPFDQGITNFHYFHDDFMPSKDEEFWMILTSDTTGVPDTTQAKYFHGNDIHIDDVSFAPGLDPDGNNKGGEISWGFSTGPVSLASGDSMQLEIAIVCGDDEQDLFENIEWIWFLANNAWNGSNPPEPPQVNTFGHDGKVTVTWNTDSESSTDNITGFKDFEGYKVYRSSNRGIDWGDEITNAYGEFVGYKPIAQYDFNNEISGFDPISNQFIGSNSGLKHTFVDSTVTNGMEYWYSVTAYDRGDDINQVESLESSIGLDTSEINISWASPSNLPQNYTSGTIVQDGVLLPDSGFTDGIVLLEIIDPFQLKTRNYIINFRENTIIYEDTLIIDTTTTFTLKDADTDEILLLNYRLSDESDDNLPLIDGLRLSIKDAEAGKLVNEWTKVVGDTCTFYWDINTIGPNDFPVVYFPDSIKFIIEIDTIATGGLTAKYYDLWSGIPQDSSTYLPLKIYTSVKNSTSIDISQNTWLGEFISSPFGVFSEPGWDLIPGGAGYAPIQPYPDRIIMEYITTNTDTFGVWLVTNNGDSTATPPSHGDEFTIRIEKAFTNDVVYTFSTIGGNYTNILQEDLNKIKVVPNPYFVTSAFDDRIMFTHLPNQCDIKIFTVAGDLVKTINHTDNLGIEYWNMKNDEGLEVAYGLYVYVIKTRDNKKHIGKFSIIR